MFQKIREETIVSLMKKNLDIYQIIDEIPIVKEVYIM